jgi:predicted PP-loop superfamily ATPase
MLHRNCGGEMTKQELERIAILERITKLENEFEKLKELNEHLKMIRMMQKLESEHKRTKVVEKHCKLIGEN